MAEVQFRRAIQITQGDLSVFVTRPISLTLLLIAAAVLLAPLIKMTVRFIFRRPSPSTS
jgi:putative tricarboxylic transport membrane protein